MNIPTSRAITNMQNNRNESSRGVKKKFFIFSKEKKIVLSAFCACIAAFEKQ